MKNILAIVVLCILSLSARAGEPISAGPFSGTVAANTILADTGALTNNNHDISVYAACTVACVAIIELRDPTNTTTVWQQYLPLVANQANAFYFERFTIVSDGSRVRVRLNAAITGAAQTSMIVD